MFKKILIISLTLLLFTSCGSDEEVAPAKVNKSAGLTQYNGAGFTMGIPSSWEVITDKSGILPKPNTGKIELAVVSKETKNNFRNNLLILSDKLEKFTTSQDFSIFNNLGASSEYLGYSAVSEKKITFADQEPSMLYVFDARYNIDTPKLRFFQTAHICNTTTAYVITLAVPTTTSEMDKYEALIKTFTCKQGESSSDI